MTVTRVVVTRQPDDTLVVDGVELPVMRASIGGSDAVGFYLQFRGDPFEVLKMLQRVVAVAQEALPVGAYEDES